LMFLDDSYDLVTNFGFRVSIVETKSVEYGWLEHGIFIS
jgi:hypothetical protein